ncbi:MAG: hypothetical protein JXB49_00245 [Bacteroidales bacterium]|nr:hypothetical protein [Bacteroidales bacterium]
MRNILIWFASVSIIISISSCGNKGKTDKEKVEVPDVDTPEVVEEEMSEMEPVENEVLNYISENLWVEVDGENFEPVNGKEIQLVTKDKKGFYYYDGSIMCDFSSSNNAERGVSFTTECEGKGVPFTCIDFAFIDEDIIKQSYFEQCARLDEEAGEYYYMKSGSEPVSYSKKPGESDSLFLCRYFNNETQNVNFVYSLRKGQDILFTLEDEMARKMEYIYNARKVGDEFVIEKLKLPESFNKLAFNEAYSFKTIEKVDGPTCEGNSCYLIIIAHYHTMEGATEGEDGFMLIDDYYGFSYKEAGPAQKKELVDMEIVKSADFKDAWNSTIYEVRSIMKNSFANN